MIIFSLEKIVCLNSLDEKFFILNDALQKFSCMFCKIKYQKKKLIKYNFEYNFNLVPSTFLYSSKLLTTSQCNFIWKYVETFKILLKVEKILDYLSNTFALTKEQISVIKVSFLLKNLKLIFYFFRVK